MKHVCKRDLLRNPYKHIGSEPVIGTQHGNPDLFVGKIDTVANLNATLDTLNSFKSSLMYSSTVPFQGGGGGAGGGTSPIIDTSGIKTEIDNNRQEMMESMLVDTGSPMKGVSTFVDTQTNQPIVQKGGQIKYEKHSHK